MPTQLKHIQMQTNHKQTYITFIVNCPHKSSLSVARKKIYAKHNSCHHFGAVISHSIRRLYAQRS